MTYSHIIDVPAPIEFYDVSHAAIREIAGPDGVDGLLVHVGRATDAGFEIVEVWQSKEHAERFVQDLWPKVMAKIPGGAGMEAPLPREFELRGLNMVGRDDLFV